MIQNILKKMIGLEKTKMVLIVRTDIKMGKGKIAAQCAHAAISLYASALNTNNVPLKSWIYSGQPKVVLKVDKDCEITLKTLYDIATKSNLNAYLVHDAGKTQVESGSITVLGLGPNKIEDIDKLTNHLKLL